SLCVPLVSSAIGSRGSISPVLTQPSEPGVNSATATVTQTGTGSGNTSTAHVDALLEENAKLRQRATEANERNIELQSELRLTERKMHDQVDEFLIEREQLRKELNTTQQQLKAAD